MAKHYYLCFFTNMMFLLKIVEFCFSGLGFLTRPLAILSALLTALSVAFLNDRFFFLLLFPNWLNLTPLSYRKKSIMRIVIYSFAGSFSEKATRTVRRFSPQLAAKMRPPLTYVYWLASPFCVSYSLLLVYHLNYLCFIDLSFVDAHRQREQYIYVANPVGSLS